MYVVRDYRATNNKLIGLNMIMTLSEQMKVLVATIEEKEKKIKEIDSELELLCAELIKKHSPYKKGDIIKCNASHDSGKSIIVEHVSIQNSMFKWRWRVLGYVLKKDGTPGRKKAFFYTDMNLEQ